MFIYTLVSVVIGSFLVQWNVCSFVLTANQPITCPDGYNYSFNGTCYLLSHDSEPWVNALMSCQILQGHLVEVESAAEANYLRTISNGKGQIRWIALTTKRALGSWEWATSHRKLTASSFNDWASGEPDNYNHDGIHDESCGAMDADTGHQYHWADLECFRPEQYICETDLMMGASQIIATCDFLYQKAFSDYICN